MLSFAQMDQYFLSDTDANNALSPAPQRCSIPLQQRQRWTDVILCHPSPTHPHPHPYRLSCVSTELSHSIMTYRPVYTQIILKKKVNKKGDADSAALISRSNDIVSRRAISLRQACLNRQCVKAIGSGRRVRSCLRSMTLWLLFLLPPIPLGTITVLFPRTTSKPSYVAWPIWDSSVSTSSWHTSHQCETQRASPERKYFSDGLQRTKAQFFHYDFRANTATPYTDLKIGFAMATNNTFRSLENREQQPSGKHRSHTYESRGDHEKHHKMFQRNRVSLLTGKGTDK